MPDDTRQLEARARLPACGDCHALREELSRGWIALFVIKRRLELGCYAPWPDKARSAAFVSDAEMYHSRQETTW